MADANPVNPYERPEPTPHKRHNNPREVRISGTDAGTEPSRKDVEGKQDRPIARAAKQLDKARREGGDR